MITYSVHACLTNSQDMGLGKTLTVLSLIASSFDKTAKPQPQCCHTTLVVAPLSSKTLDPPTILR